MIDCKALPVARARGLDGWMDTLENEKNSNFITVEVCFKMGKL